MEMQERNAVHLERDGGRKIRAPGGHLTYKVSSGQTGGAYSLFEQCVPPGEGTPPHIQHREDECVYVVEGEIEFLIGEETVMAGTGSLIYVPRGTVHAFTNTGPEPARILDLLTPGSTRERLLQEIGESADGNAQPDAEEIRRISARYGTEVLPAG